MLMENENNQNEEFKNKLFDFEEPVSDLVWEGITGKIDKPNKRRKWVIWWLPALCLFLVGSGLVFHKYVGFEPNASESGSDQIQVQSVEKQKRQAIEKPVASAKTKDLTVSESQEIIRISADKASNRKEPPNENNKPDQAPSEKSGVNSKSNGNRSVAQASILPQILSDVTSFNKEGISENKRKGSGRTKPVSGRNFKIRTQQNGVLSRRNATGTLESKDSKSGETNEMAANALQPESNKIAFNEKSENLEAKSKLVSETPNETQAPQAPTFGSKPIDYLPIKMAVLETGYIGKSIPVVLNLIPLETAPAPTGPIKEKPKDRFARKWHFGASASALGAVQQVVVVRNVGEWNAASLPVLSNIKNSLVFEGSIFASCSLTSRFALGANAGFSTWKETVNFQTLSGTKSQFTLEPIPSPTIETSFQGNPINDQRFTQSRTTRYTSFWFQPKLAFKLAKNWPVWLKPGYQIMVFNVQTASWASGINGPTVELSFRKRHLELGFKCLFFRQRDQIRFVPQSKVNSFWLGTTVGWWF